MTSDRDIKDIEAYLSGELNAVQQAEFEEKLRNDKNFRQKVELTKKVIEGIKGSAFKQMLKDIHKNNFGIS